MKNKCYKGSDRKTIILQDIGAHDIELDNNGDLFNINRGVKVAPEVDVNTGIRTLRVGDQKHDVCKITDKYFRDKILK